MTASTVMHRIAGKSWEISRLAAQKFWRSDGPQLAGTFSFFAFFGVFPLIVLLINFASLFVNQDRAGEAIITYIESYLPIGEENRSYVFDTFAHLVKTRGKASAIASLTLSWAIIRALGTLIRANNRAWNAEAHNWWRLPLKSLALLGILALMILVGITLPVVMNMGREWFLPENQTSAWAYTAGRFLFPVVVTFLSVSLFYKIAPHRLVRFRDVWIAALCATFLMRIAEFLFAVYLKNFARLNVVYGAFGGIMAMLLWIYISSCILIFGACLCAARSDRELP